MLVCTCLALRRLSTLEYYPRSPQPCRPFDDADAEDGRGGGDDAGYNGDGDDEEDDMAGQEYGFVMYDPVWGKPDYPPGHRTTKCQVRANIL